jgi:hypothetical protein
MPCTSLPANSASNDVNHGTVTAVSATAAAARRIAVLRPTRSDSQAHGNTDSASPNVVADTNSDTREASTAVSSAICVNSPCGAYISENAASPAHHSAADNRRSDVACPVTDGTGRI